MTQHEQGIYEFHNFQLDIGKGILLRENQPVTLQWKTFELLSTLVRSNGNLITRDELMNELWADTFVEDNNLSQHIRALRRALGDGENGAKFIETVAGRGYRFLPEVSTARTEIVKEPVARNGENAPVAAEDNSELPASASLLIVPPAIVSDVSGSGKEKRRGRFPAIEDSMEIASNKRIVTETVASFARTAGAPESSKDPEISFRRRSLRHGLKFSLWGSVTGFVFMFLIQILQILSSILLTTPDKFPEGLQNLFENLLVFLLIPMLSGYFVGIGLFLFGVFRMIYALFEKEGAGLHSSLVERWIAIVLISVIAAVGIPNLIASYRTAQEFRQKPAETRPPNEKAAQFLNFSTVRYQKIIETQQGHAAISPDGRFLVYTDTIGGRQALWLRQLAANINIQILPPDEADYGQLKFSHDSEYVYFNYKNSLYRVSVLGGEPILILKEVEVFSLSPDDKQFAFTRKLPDHQCGLLIAETDGSAERVISRRPSPNCYKTAAWSPDGKLIAFAVGQSDTGDANTELFAHQIADGNEFSLSGERWYHIHSIVWLPGQSGLILSGRKQISEENPLWQVSYPGGETRQLTDGLVRYTYLNLTADGKHLLASQSVLNTSLSIAPAEDASDLRKLSSAFYGMTWLPDGKIVYSSHINKNSLWTINADGTGQKQLTFDDAGYLNPVASPDGRYIFYTLTGKGPSHIWRMNADGTGKIQITDGRGEQKPNVSSDGKWLFYQVPGKSPITIWKISTAGGGAPAQVTKDHGTNPSVSPDGKLLAYISRKEPEKDYLEIVVKSLENEQIVGKFSPPDDEFIGTSKILWTKDGRALIYTRERIDRIANIWIQPLDGSAAKQITDYSSDRIFDFGWSSDGKQLAVIRGSWKYEAVLISGFR